MARALIVAGLLLSATAASYTQQRNPLYVHALAADSSRCLAPITFMCRNDPSDNYIGPKPYQPKDQTKAATGDTTGYVLLDAAVGLSSWFANSLFGSSSAVATTTNSAVSSVASSAAGIVRSLTGGEDSSASAAADSAAADQSNEKRASFYHAADKGSECRVISGDLAVSTVAHPNPEHMVQSQRDASYFHVFCGDVSNFHREADEFMTAKIRGQNVDLKEGTTASEHGILPARWENGEYYSEAKKLRNTALIIVPGGSYRTLSLYESIVMPLEVIFDQKHKADLSQKTNKTAAAAATEAAKAAYKATVANNDFVPIVLQYRVTPNTPSDPTEDISKVVRMLERYRQKRFVNSLAVGSDASTGKSNAHIADESFDEGDKQFKEAVLNKDPAIVEILAAREKQRKDSAAKKESVERLNSENVDANDLGFTDAERAAYAASQSKRLSPSMLGLTDDFKIVIVGFSAGGHAAASYAAMTNAIPIAATVLVYPVIAMDRPDIAHYHSTVNLLNIEPNITKPTPSALKNLPEGVVVPPVLESPPAPDASAAPTATTTQNKKIDDDEDSLPRTTSVPLTDEDKTALEVFNEQRAVLRRFSPHHFPSNFPQCVYLAHTQTDPVVNVEHSRLMFSSLVRHRQDSEVKKRTIARMELRRRGLMLDGDQRVLSAPIAAKKVEGASEDVKGKSFGGAGGAGAAPLVDKDGHKIFALPDVNEHDPEIDHQGPIRNNVDKKNIMNEDDDVPPAAAAAANAEKDQMEKKEIGGDSAANTRKKLMGFDTEIEAIAESLAQESDRAAIRLSNVVLPPIVLEKKDPETGRDLGTLEISYGVALRTYPVGPHGRWWVNKADPELKGWWGEVQEYLKNNNCI